MRLTHLLPTGADCQPVKAVTYSKAIQTTAVSMSTSTSDLEDDDDEDEIRRKRATDDGVGRETEDEMRKRILQELEEERKALEKELQELKNKEIERPPGMLPRSQICRSSSQILRPSSVKQSTQHQTFRASLSSLQRSYSEPLATITITPATTPLA